MDYYDMTGACSEHNVRCDWQSAGASFSGNAHMQQTKQKTI